MVSPIFDPKNPIVVLKFKQVIGLLYESSKPLTAEEIDARVDVQGIDKAIFFQKLSTYPTVLFDGQSYSYRSARYLRDAMRLRLITREFAEVDLKDDDATVTEEEGKRRLKKIKLTTPKLSDLLKYTPEGIARAREEEENRAGDC